MKVRIATSCQSLLTRSMNVPDVPTAVCAIKPSPVRCHPCPRQMMTRAITAKADDTPDQPAGQAADGGWCCDVQRIPTADSARTMPVKAVIARRMALRAVIVNGFGERPGARGERPRQPSGGSSQVRADRSITVSG